MSSIAGNELDISEPERIGVDDYPVPKRYAWYAFTLLLLLTTCSLMDRAVIAALFPQLRAEWGLTDTQLGALVSAVNWSMAVFALPTALLVDRWSRKKAMGLMAAIWTAATMGCGLAYSYTHLFLARLLIGAGEGGFGSGGASIISSLFPTRLRASAFGIFNAAGAFGGVLGVALGGYVAVRWGWRMAFFAVAVPGLVIALLFMLTVRDSPTIALKVVDSGAQRNLSSRELARDLLSTRSLLAIYFAGICSIFCTISLMAWLPTYFNRTANMAMDEAAARSAVLILMIGVGAMLGGIAADQLGRRRRNMLMIIPAAYAFISSAVIALALTQLQGTLQFVVLLFGTLFSSAGIGPMFAVTQAVVHPGLRATAVGICNTLWQLLGGMGPLATGLLSDKLGVAMALLLTLLMPIAGGLALLAGSRYYAGDADRMAKLTTPVTT